MNSLKTHSLWIGPDIALVMIDSSTLGATQKDAADKGDTDMKRLVVLSFAGLTLAGAGFGQTSSSWAEQWHEAKYGRYSAAEEARQKADVANTAFREETSDESTVGTNSAQRTNTWIEQWQKVKSGRYSAAEEARRRAEQSSTAYREQSAAEKAPLSPASTTNDVLEQRYKVKYGRYSEMEEARQRAESRQ